MTSKKSWSGFIWLTPVSSYLLLAGVLRILWPEALSFIGGLLALVFIYVSWTHNPVYAIRIMGMILFPMGYLKFHTPEEMEAKHKAKQPEPKSKRKPKDILYDSSTDGPPEPMSDDELRAAADYDARKAKWRSKSSPGFSMDDLDEEPF